jgi:hypothetical protein
LNGNTLAIHFLISTRFSARQLLGVGLNLCRQARGLLTGVSAAPRRMLNTLEVYFLAHSRVESAQRMPSFPLPLFVTSIEIGNAEESANLALVGELLAAHEQHVLCERKDNES